MARSNFEFDCVGNLGTDPEMIEGGACRIFLITNDNYKDKEGAMQEISNAVNITVWGAQSTSCAEYLKKGRQVRVTGRVRFQKKDDKTYTNFEADRVTFLGGKKDA